MTTHPSEPWQVIDRFGIQAADLRRVDICHLATADRIVACVNACAGMPDPAAEIADLRANDHREYKERVREQGLDPDALDRAMEQSRRGEVVSFEECEVEALIARAHAAIEPGHEDPTRRADSCRHHRFSPHCLPLLFEYGVEARDDPAIPSPGGTGGRHAGPKRRRAMRARDPRPEDTDDPDPDPETLPRDGHGLPRYRRRHHRLRHDQGRGAMT